MTPRLRRFLLLLLLLLLPAFASAQLPPSPDWSQNLATCTPDEGAAPYLYFATNSLTVRPGTVTPVLPGPFGRSPLLVRCPIHGQGHVVWNEIELVAHDPDSIGPNARLHLELKRQRLPVTGEPPAVRAETLVVWDSRRLYSPDHAATYRIDLGQSNWYFDLYTYWLEVSLLRLDRTALPPRAYLVRLHRVP